MPAGAVSTDAFAPEGNSLRWVSALKIGIA